ncbi:conserved membrane protein of unknown function [Bradyrhizobium sp. ORS 285]|uniref:DUF4149 domain-containing protein n=1 Tax=Bradyrhizobium sp. ORS 285 TaxID=115808 RepID=UPI000240677B|nr:DUF4149 domain-containing protein [Bradyrhizobium sp. ORS 285]CCD86054.1 conserved membrane hypothetical protein [Bradyrhizobium sp. ORS 285]SMX61358.1 conserved membrane protein of unknown function [Bradyrhizobium sp. ORS 285]
MINAAALLITALLFGGMTLFSFGFAPFLFSALPAETTRTLIRRAFPHFYLFVIATAAVAGLLALTGDELSGAALLAIALTAALARQILMPAINRAADAGEKRRFARLHGASVMLTLIHIVLSAAVLLRLAQ